MTQVSSHTNRITKRYETLLADYLKTDLISSFQNDKNESILQDYIDQKEQIAISDFLKSECRCGNNCNNKFSEEELLSTRAQFRSLSLSEKNCYMLSQLRILSKHSSYANSSGAKTTRVRQKFDYRINIDRVVCREAFLFYHGETIKRLKRLQECLQDTPLCPPTHGNFGRQPVSTYSLFDKELATLFIMNLAEIHGLPDPGRDVRKGKGRLRMLLPSIMNYTSIHRLYEASVLSIGRAIAYRTFLEIWQKNLPYIEFNNPRTDLCFTCENFKKEINKIASSMDEEKEKIQADLYQQALNHLNHVKRERLYYKAHSKESVIDYGKLLNNDIKAMVQPNSKDIVMSYSWDFAQQFQYPFEDQQVGPIYFKTPRRAQLFGVCCEGNFRQVNYLIDEADFLEKNANTVISLLDHFFTNYGLGETTVYLTADNCVGQNKNNALIQYLVYRILSNLHNKIEMSFLVVGHTKFSPDSHFGLLRKQYRNSSVYTYDQLANLIDQSIQSGCNHCHRYSKIDNEQTGIVYRNWSDWLNNYFKTIPSITSYHHFIIDHEDKGSIILKKDMESSEEKINIIKVPYDFASKRVYPEGCLIPPGLSEERQWYLYDQIRQYIPNEDDKDKTCPRPKCHKPKTTKKETLKTNP
jgi:hypothetical protein